MGDDIATVESKRATTVEASAPLEQPPSPPAVWPIGVAFVVVTFLGPVLVDIAWNFLGAVRDGFYVREFWPSAIALALAELTFLAIAWLTELSYRSSDPVAQRLGWNRAAARPARIAISVVLLFAVGYASGATSDWFGLERTSEFEEDQFVAGLTALQLVVYLIPSSLLPGLCEELFFRGLAFRHLARRVSPLTAALISAAMFGAIHGEPGRIVPTFAFGLVAAWVVLRVDSVIPVVIAHAAMNASIDIQAWANGPPQFGTFEFAWSEIIVPTIVAAAAASGLVLVTRRKLPLTPLAAPP